MKTKNVLVVDDIKNIRTLLTTCLELEGYQVATASDGKQALAMLVENTFALAFLDIKLPGVSGTEVLRKLRERGDQTPIIIMTAFATVKNAVECTKLGAVAYLQKPFTADKVRNVLREINDSLHDKPADADFFLNSGKNSLSRGHYDEAFNCFKQALAADPGRSETYGLMAQVYHFQGDVKEAERFRKIARQLEE